jgi:hypothetical protein
MRMYVAKNGNRGPGVRVRNVPTIAGECVIRFVDTERTLNATPIARQIRSMDLGRAGADGLNATTKAKNVTGINVPAAHATPTQNIIFLPVCAPATPVTHKAATSVNVVNLRLTVWSGEAFQTRTAKQTRMVATPKSGK